jgi:peptidoglycan/LPS O-acetylase OafA/YrhL
MRRIAWFQMVVGSGMLLIWPALIATGEVPEIAAGQRDIWFHIAAEALAGLLLVLAGWSLLRRDADDRSRLLSAFALGALLYTGVNSAGHYADLGEWWPMALLVLVGGLASSSFLLLRRRASDEGGACDPATASAGERTS